MPLQPHHTAAGHLIRDLLSGFICISIVTSATAEDAKPPIASALLSNGNKLSGKSISTDKGQLIFESDQLQKPARLKLDQVLSVQFAHPPLPQPNKLEALLNFHGSFRMTQADSLAGELLSINKDSVVFKTNDNGTKTVKRSFISSIETLQLGENYYRGPNSAREWGIDAKNKAWNFTRNHLNSQSSGGAGRDAKLTEKSHISFTAKWKTSMRFRILLYTSDHNDNTPDAYYDLNFNRSYAYLRTRGKVNGGKDLARGGRWKQLNLPRNLTSVHFDIFTDRKAGTITVYINKLRACVLQSQTPDPSDLGTGVRFIAEERYPIKISDIVIRPWDGVVTPPAPAAAAAVKAKHPFLTSSDGKTHTFTTLKKEDKHYIIVAPDQAAKTTRILAINVLKIVMPPAGAQPRKYANDVRVQFQHGGQLTFQLKSISNGKLQGHSKLLGDLTYDLRAFSQIDFNIYAHNYEKLRRQEP